MVIAMAGIRNGDPARNGQERLAADYSLIAA